MKIGLSCGIPILPHLCCSPIRLSLSLIQFIMALRYGLPVFLEDKSGRLTGSEFVDLYDRMKLNYRRIARDSERTVYGIYDTSPGSESPNTAVITLTFGADNSLGTIRVRRSNDMEMDTYLSRVTIFARWNLFLIFIFSPLTNKFLIVISSKSRHFVASDNQRYRWRHRYADDQEWAVSFFFLILLSKGRYWRGD